MAEGSPQNHLQETGARSKGMRPPNKKKFEEEQKAIVEQIRAKEAEVKSLGKPSRESLPEVTEERSVLNAKLKSLRAEKFQTIGLRQEKDLVLQNIRSEITKKGDALSKLEASLPYRTSESLLKALKNLEYQLQHKRLTSREENRLVREIETLKRSAVNVREYNQKKKDIEAVKDRRKKIKEDKDKDFNHVTALKQEEEQVKQRLDAIKRKEDEAWARYREGGDKREQLKAEIDCLYERKRQALTNHRTEQQKYELHMREYREGERLRIEETRRVRAAERVKQRKEYDESREPYLQERQTCAALILYLQSYIPPDGGDQLRNTVVGVRHSTESLNQSDLEPPADYTVLRRKGGSDDEAPPRRRKGKRHRRQSGHGKSLRHSNQIFSKFVSLKVDAPPTMSEVVETLVKLRSKLEYLERLAREEKLQQSDRSSSYGGSSDQAMSDYSAGTADLLQDFELLETSDDASRDGTQEEEVDYGQEPQSLHSEVSRDDGIHSLESNESTLLELGPNSTSVGGSEDNTNLEEDSVVNGHGANTTDSNNGGPSELFCNLREAPKTVLEKNGTNSDKDNGFDEGQTVLVDRAEDSGVMFSEGPLVGTSIGGCSIGQSSLHDPSAIGQSKDGTISYIRTLSDAYNQNDIVPVEPS